MKNLEFLKFNTFKVIKLLVVLIAIVFAYVSMTFARPYTVCKGKEFNSRVRAFLNGDTVKEMADYSITGFERGYNPPDDPNYYVDVSEDLDSSVIVYIRPKNMTANSNNDKETSENRYTLYWYSDHIVNMNPDTAFMFDKFVNIRNIDLSGFSYLDGLSDTRYMFLDCRNLRNLHFKRGTGLKTFMPSEMQGMFFNCQSLTNIDLTLFETKMVDNMDEMFCNCYNLANIYVEKDRWNTENVKSYIRMFTNCHSLITNNGTRATDIPEDEYEKYAVVGTDKVNGFIRDVNYNYESYYETTGDSSKSIPIDDERSIPQRPPETIEQYLDEPEYDEGAYTKNENGNASGGGVETAPKVETAPARETSPIKETTAKIETMPVPQTLPIIIETTPVPETTKVIETAPIIETTNSADIVETSGMRMIEIDEYLNGEKEEFLGGLFNNYKFLLLTLGVLMIVIILLVGMVVFLTKSSFEDKNDDSHQI